MSDNAFSDEYSEEFKRHEELDFLDRCAIAAMASFIAEDEDMLRSEETIAEMAYGQAEAMLAERTKRRANRGT